MGEYSAPTPWRTSAKRGHRAVVDAKGRLVADCNIVGPPETFTDKRAKQAALLTSAAPDLFVVCKEVEWSGETDRGEGGYEPACPQCGSARRFGHQPACSLAAAIAKAEGRAS